MTILTDLSALSFEIGDTFVCWASFEERSSQIFDRLPLGVQKVVFASNQHEYPFGGTFSGIRRRGSRLDVRWIDRDNQIMVYDQLVELLASLAHGRMWIDVTCFPREFLAILVKVLSRYKHDRHERVILLYSQAHDYSVKAKSDDEKWLVKGVQSVAPILGFRGVRRPGSALALVGMLGFDVDRFLLISNEIQPDRFLLGVGGTLVVERGWMENKNARAVSSLRSFLDYEGEFRFSCDDVGQCMADVEGAISGVDASTDIMVVNLNNKISVIATALLGLKIPRLRLCHSSGVVYNWKEYSAANGKVIVLAADELMKL